VPGTVVETNEAAFRADILVANRDPYGTGWLVRLQPDAWDPAAIGLVTGPDAVTSYDGRIDELGISCFRCAD
jgi:glycine cleavage system H protein